MNDIQQELLDVIEEHNELVEEIHIMHEQIIQLQKDEYELQQKQRALGRKASTLQTEIRKTQKPIKVIFWERYMYHNLYKSKRTSTYLKGYSSTVDVYYEDRLIEESLEYETNKDYTVTLHQTRENSPTGEFKKVFIQKEEYIKRMTPIIFMVLHKERVKKVQLPNEIVLHIAEKLV
jgi:hypothetical protein